MINLTELQKTISDNARFLGYKTNKKESIKKIKQELKEFRKSPKQHNVSRSYQVSCIKDDEKFRRFYDLYLKNTVQDEAIDLILVAISYLDYEGIDSETALMNKIRYNKLRPKK